MYSLPVYLVTLFVIFISPTYGQVESTTKFRLLIKKPNTLGNSCKTKNDEVGICVHKSTCNNDHKIEIGGILLESEVRKRKRAAYYTMRSYYIPYFRNGGGCNLKLGEWCCLFKNTSTTETARGVATTVLPEISREGVTSEITTATPRQGQKNCLVTDQNDCPWFVKLYRSGQDSPYCLGAMIGSNTILTTATCELHARKQFIFARVPNSVNPEANYTIISRLRHPGYNSGTRFNDIALLSTLTNIEWGSSGPKGACIDPELSLGGECAAANINEYNDLDMVSLFVTQGSCTSQGYVPDAMCGNGVFNDLLDGAPIMCQKNNYYVLSGITKTSYPSDGSKALLGNLDYTWLTDNLKTIAGMNEADYLFKLNYN